MGKNLQDFILNQMRKTNMAVTVYLLNGFQLYGRIKSFDNYVIILEVDGRLQMVYKHAVSTVIPKESLSLKIQINED